MTLRHLLTMSTGLDWNEVVPYADPTNTSTIMQASPDWVQYTLDRPMAEMPGELFNYNTGATLILGHIFRLATGVDLEEYAVQTFVCADWNRELHVETDAARTPFCG